MSWSGCSDQDYYRDYDTNICTHCGQLCHPRHETLPLCLRFCSDYYKRTYTPSSKAIVHSTTIMPRSDIDMEFDEGSPRSTFISVSVLLCVMLVIIITCSILIYYKQSCCGFSFFSDTGITDKVKDTQVKRKIFWDVMKCISSQKKYNKNSSPTHLLEATCIKSNTELSDPESASGSLLLIPHGDNEMIPYSVPESLECNQGPDNFGFNVHDYTVTNAKCISIEVSIHNSITANSDSQSEEDTPVKDLVISQEYMSQKREPEGSFGIAHPINSHEHISSGEESSGSNRTSSGYVSSESIPNNAPTGNYTGLNDSCQFNLISDSLLIAPDHIPSIIGEPGEPQNADSNDLDLVLALYKLIEVKFNRLSVIGCYINIHNLELVLASDEDIDSIERELLTNVPNHLAKYLYITTEINSTSEHSLYSSSNSNSNIRVLERTVAELNTHNTIPSHQLIYDVVL